MKDARSLALILSEIDAALGELLDLTLKKQGMLVSGDVAGLEKVVSAEQDLVAKLELLEKDRSSVAEAAGTSGASSSLRESLRDKAKKIADANERNRGLLKQGLEIVQYGLKLLMPQTGYGNLAAKGPLVFDHKV